jgi:hypothetical protein
MAALRCGDFCLVSPERIFFFNKRVMVYWKSSTKTQKHASPFAPVKKVQTAEDGSTDVTYTMTTLEIVVLVITFVAFIGQFINIGYAIADHGRIKKITTVLQSRGLV